MDISINSIKKPLVSFLTRFHVVIFSVIVIGGLSIVILILYGIIISSGENTDYTPAGNNSTFDQATIDRVNQLKSRDETSASFDLPEGRINPFVE